MKPGTVRQQPQTTIIRGVVNPPPRIQKQILAQQQAAQATTCTPDQKPTLWTADDSPKQGRKENTSGPIPKRTLWQDPEAKPDNR